MGKVKMKNFQGTHEICVGVNMSVVLTVVMVLRAHTFVKFIELYILNVVSLSYVN